MSEELVPPDFLMRPELFESYFIQRENYGTIRNLAVEGHLGSIHNRFITWRIFLGILPESQTIEAWVARTQELRAEHDRILKSHRNVKTDNLDPLIFNPLSSASENPWNNFHVDNELKGVIRNDVQRTFQERPLFQLSSIQELMVSVLFTWAKENSDISYKQGMNELLAIVLFVAYAEKAPDYMNVSMRTQDLINTLNDPKHMEADVYWLFERLMDLGIAELFNPVVTNRPVNKKNNLFTWDAERHHNDLVNQDKSASDNVSSVLKRCHKIHHRILQGVDKELYLYLEKQKIEPQMYLQRYLRCILSREFNLADTLILWDAIFAKANQPGDNGELALIDYICVAMIIFVRAFVLQSDYSGILRRLLKFPPVEDVHILVSMAISYQERMQAAGSKTVFAPPAEPAKPSFAASGPSSNPFMQSKAAVPAIPSQVLTSGPKAGSNPLLTPSVKSTTPTNSKLPFGSERAGQAIPSNPLSQSGSTSGLNPLNAGSGSGSGSGFGSGFGSSSSSGQSVQPAKPFITPSEITSGKRPGIFDPLQSKPEPQRVETKFVAPGFKASSPVRPSQTEDKKEPKTPEESKEEVKDKKVLARSENSFVEKCNTALLLLLEQSDEGVFMEDKMNKALQVLMSLKEDIAQEITKKNAEPLRKF